MRIPKTTWALLAMTAHLQGAAIYTTSVSSTFSIGPGGVMLGPTPGTKVETGTGVAAFGVAASPGGVKPGTIESFVSGSASPSGFAESTQFAGHLFSLDNTSGTGTLVVPFTFSFSWDVTVGVSSPAFEFARAGGFFHITGIDNEVLKVGGLSVPEYLLNPMYDTSGGGTGGMGDIVITGTIEVPEGALSVFSVITDTSGNATAVPEPAAAGVCLTGGLALIVLRRACLRP